MSGKVPRGISTPQYTPSAIPLQGVSPAHFSPCPSRTFWQEYLFRTLQSLSAYFDAGAGAAGLGAGAAVLGAGADFTAAVLGAGVAGAAEL